MSGMLNSLLDINQLEAGVIRPEFADFPVNDLLERMKTEFAYHMQRPRAGMARASLPVGGAQRSSPARADDPQSAVERGEIHQERRGPARLPAARRQVAYRGLGHRPGHPRGATAGDLPGIPSDRQSRPRTEARGWASVSPSCNAWAICWAIPSMFARAAAAARCFRSRFPLAAAWAAAGAARH